MSVRITFKGFTYHEAGAIQQVAPILRKVHASLTRQIATGARHRVPVLTGNLGRSIAEDAQTWPGVLHVSGGVTAHAKYAVFVHEGTGVHGPRGAPFVIRPKNPGGVLHFYFNGREVFAKSVTVQGMRARPFLRKAGIAVAHADPRVHGI